MLTALILMYNNIFVVQYGDTIMKENNIDINVIVSSNISFENISI